MLYEVTLNGECRGQFEAADSSEAVRLARVGFADDVRVLTIVQIPPVDPLELSQLEGDGSVDPTEDLESIAKEGTIESPTVPAVDAIVPVNEAATLPVAADPVNPPAAG